MPMKYIKVYYDWTDATQMLKDAEKGRLIDAMVKYARGEGLPKDFSGNEQYVFPMFKLQLDRDGDAYEEVSEKRRQAGAKGGKQKVANASKSKQMLANASKSYQDKDKDKDHDHDKDDTSYLKKKIDQNWKTSTRARGAVAQVLVDEIRDRGYNTARLADLHDALFNAMTHGLTPEELLDHAREGAMAFCVWLGERGAPDDP